VADHEKAETGPICPCPDDECLRMNGPDCQKPLSLEERLALLDAVFRIGPRDMFPDTPRRTTPPGNPGGRDA
jgi:hypothetical protein